MIEKFVCDGNEAPNWYMDWKEHANLVVGDEIFTRRLVISDWALINENNEVELLDYDKLITNSNDPITNAVAALVLKAYDDGYKAAMNKVQEEIAKLC